MAVHYNISPLHQCEADIRLSDAMLFAALKSALGDQIEVHSSIHEYGEDGPLWGLDHYGNPEILRRRAAAYREPAVLAALEGVIVPARDAGAVMDEISARGIGPAMHSMADPIDRYYCPGQGGTFSGPAGHFERQKDRLRVQSPDDEIFIRPAYEMVAVRRYLIVAGGIAAETPYAYSEEDPGRILDPANRMKEPERFLGPLVDADPAHLALQRAAVETLLSEYPMVSGAVDVGIVIGDDGTKRAQIEQVWAAPPGGVPTLFADPAAYAAKIAEHLHELEPSLNEEDAPRL